ncbi:unnamed protein product [Knipowitschia caucasica]|uniref:KIAA2013 n=2 Tax=Knipowitschia caucasica TaxID=637954 RepID=A0AAV2M1X7_KNICA
MWLQQRLKGLQPRLKGLPSLLSSSWARRLLIGLLLFLIFSWYLGGDRKWPLLSRGALPGGAPGQCILSEVHRWKSVVERGEGVYRSPQEPLDTPFVTGNGHLLLDLDSNRLWVSGSAQSGSAPVHQTLFSPRVGVRVEGQRAEARASLLWFKKGAVLSVRCVSWGPKDCVTVREELMAHRSLPHVFVQRLHIHNPTERTATVELSQSGGAHFLSSVERLDKDTEALLWSGRVQLDQSRVLLVVAASRRLGSHLQVAPKSEQREQLLTVVHTSEPLEAAHADEALSALREAAKKELQEVMHISVDELVTHHQQAWSDLFISGVEMHVITDAHTPSSRTVNSTLYYVLSAAAAPLLDVRLPQDERSRLESSVRFSDHCFSGHATMHADTLWPDRLSGAAHILQLATLWTLTLQKRGCKDLVSAGAHGVVQAMVLSFGGLQFTEHHLQFQADPDVLHNSYALRGIHYHSAALSLAVRLDAEGKPFLHVWLKPQEKPLQLFACEAGCMNEPVELSAEVRGHTFPVMVTQPVTPLLYISTDLRHLQELRHTLHVKTIVAHQEHMASRERGLPFLFWFSVFSLITLFHLFLFKLIYNEYCGPGAKPLFRSKV